MKKTISAVAVLALGATLAFAGLHEGKGHGRHGKGGGFELSGKMAEKLNLTDAQKQQINDLNKNFKDQNAAFLESFRQTMTDVREAKKANDTARLDALRPTVESQKAQMKQLRDAQHQRVLSVLSAEQRTQLEAFKAERESRREKRDRD